MSTDCNTQFPIISRETLKIVCDLASSEKDKKLIKYAVSCGGNMSREAAKKKYGISDLTLLKNTAENAIEQAREIRDAVDHLSNVKEDCILEELGIFCGNDSKSDSDESESSDDETSENDSDTGCPDDVDSENNGQNSDVPPKSSTLDPDVIMKGMATVSPAPGNEHLLMLLRENNHNWFSFVGELKMLLHMYTPEVLNQVLVDFAAFLPFSDLSDEEERLVEQSRQAFLMTERRVAREDDDVLSDSESDDPEDWVDVGKGLTEKMKSLVVNEKRKQKKRDRRRFLKLVAEKSVLKRRVPKRASKLLKQFPNLGKDIEDFVNENRVGADA